MFIGTIFGILGIADIAFFIKNISKYKQLQQLIKYLSQTEYLNVSDIINQFKQLPIGSKIPIIVKGIIKAKSSNQDKNILSAIVSTQINKSDRLKQYLLDRVPYRQVLAQAFWLRPQKLKNLQFNLQDLNGLAKLSVQECKNTDVSAILSQLKNVEVFYGPSPSKIIQTIKSILNALLFLNPFKLLNKIGQKLTYYGIIDNTFGYVIGQARKKANGQILIQNPRFITKQVGFILNRLKKKLSIYKYALIIYALLQLVLIYYFVKWAFRNYGQKFKLFGQQQQVVEENLPFHQLCIVCYSSSRSVIFKPCKHYGVCFHCYKRMTNKNCPVCKQPIEGIIRVIKK